MKYDYIVIGGGIIGMTTAREIATRGASVAILDRQKFGNEAFLAQKACKMTGFSKIR